MKEVSLWEEIVSWEEQKKVWGLQKMAQMELAGMDLVLAWRELDGKELDGKELVERGLVGKELVSKGLLLKELLLVQGPVEQRPHLHWQSVWSWFWQAWGRPKTWGILEEMHLLTEILAYLRSQHLVFGQVSVTYKH